MALEQLRAFRAGKSLDELGAVERLAPDNYPMLVSSELRTEHIAISQLLAEQGDSRAAANEFTRGPTLQRVLLGTPEQRTRFFLALIERMFGRAAGLDGIQHSPFYFFYDYGGAAGILAMLLDSGVDYSVVAVPALEWFNSFRFIYYGTEPVKRVVTWAAVTPQESWPARLHDCLVDLLGQFRDLNYPQHKDLEALLSKVVGIGSWDVLARSEVWAAHAIAELEKVPAATSEHWYALLRHCGTATSARPSAKWLKTGRAPLQPIGTADFSLRLKDWCARVDDGRARPLVAPSWDGVDERQRMHEVNANVLRGLLWLSADAKDLGLTRAVAKLALSAYRKIRGIGPRSPKIGNACVYALSEARSEDAVGQLAVLKVRVKFGTAQKEIGKAFDAASSALKIPRDEIEEMGIPSYGLEEIGVRRDTLGGFTAELRVDGRDVAVSWSDADSKPRKTVPAKVKTDHKEEFKELQAAAKDIAAMLPTQAERLDGMFLSQKRWPISIWRERYLNHPLVGTIARRLIWTIDQPSGNSAVIYHDGKMVDATDKPFDVSADARVTLWHPIHQSINEVLAWRQWLEQHEVRQPFKQAHREVYVLTDAERRTNTYSNRFAGHVLRQHQFNALCAARGWKHKLRLMVDDAYPPATRDLPQWGLRAEYWVEGAGDTYGTDTADSGAYLRVATDQVRFYRPQAAVNYAHAGGGGYTSTAAGPGTENINDPVPLEQIPPLVLSEVMRDVDLFVGVASVGNDPTWQDGGPQGRYRTYWQNYSFGELSATATTRKDVLSRLVPRLKIADRCSLVDRFLIVRGNLRTYKIHLGSGNILMEPNDQYLCIVRGGNEPNAGLFLPFEGDATLSVIISKAFLLVADDKIKDPTITRQIGL